MHAGLAQRSDRRTMLSRLLELVGDLHGFDTLDEFREEVLVALTRAVPSKWASYNEVGEHPDDLRVAMIPEQVPHLEPVFARWAHQHPLIARMRSTGDGRPRRLSDVIAQRDLHRLELYTEVYAHLGVEYQVALTMPAQLPTVIGIALSRGEEDYADEEVELLAHARPHLIQAYRNAELASTRSGVLASLEAGLDLAGRPLVVAGRHGRVEFATASARELLGDAARLPEPIVEWLAAGRADPLSATDPLSTTEPPAAAEPLQLTTARGRLLVRALPRAPGDDRTVLLLGSGDGGLDVDGLRSLGLTTRQAQTLRWIALGRSAADAAHEMGIAERTVHKHLQSVYAKLGVNSRSQAAATAWASLGPASRDVG